MTSRIPHAILMALILAVAQAAAVFGEGGAVPTAQQELPRDPSIRRILITGAAGTVGSALVKGMKDRYQIRGLDLRPVPELADSMVGDVRDFETTLKATQGMDAVIHLVNIRTNRGDWEDCLDNVTATRNILESAVRNGVRRVAYSSETGVLGPPPDTVRRTLTMIPSPGSYYSLGKVFAENLGRLYSTRHGIGFVAVRIGRIDRNSGAPKHPHDLSPGDAVRVFERAVVHPGVKYEIVFGVSDSTWNLYDLDHGRQVIQYYPQDKSQIDPPAR